MNKKGFISITSGILIATVVIVGGYFIVSNNNTLLSKNQIYNTTYDIHQNDSQQVDFRNITLINGEYTEEYFQGKVSSDTEPNCVYTLRISDSGNAITHIDYDNDGDKDVFVNLVENFCGGSGNYIYTALLENKNNKPTYVDSVELGDNVVVQKIDKSDSNNINIRLLTHRENDPNCCPSNLREYKFLISDNKFDLVSKSNIYKNEEYGFEIELPIHYVSDYEGFIKQYGSAGKSFKDINKDENTLNIALNISINPKSDFNDNSLDFIKDIKTRSGLTGKMYSGHYNFNGNDYLTTDVVFKGDKNNYIISETTEDNRNLFEDIVSTFKFIE